MNGPPSTGKTSGTRGKCFKPNEVSRAPRTEAFGTIFIVTNIDNAKKIECPRPLCARRVPDFSLGAARMVGCDGIRRVTMRRAGYK